MVRKIFNILTNANHLIIILIVNYIFFLHIINYLIKQDKNNNYFCRDYKLYFKLTIGLVWFGFVVRGESPGCRLVSTASMLEWLRISSPTTHRGALPKDGAETP